MSKSMIKKIIIIIAVLVIIGGGAFYGGMKYGENRSSMGVSRLNFQNGQLPANFQGQGRNGGAGVLNGEVIAKDEQSLTLKTPDGSSKIVFFSGSTKVSKTIDGTIDDIEIGKQIMVTGSQNSDGSYTAQTISERQLPPQPKI